MIVRVVLASTLLTVFGLGAAPGLAQTPHQTQAATHQGTVACRVVNGSASKPVPGLVVHLINKQMGTDRKRTSAQDGSVEFDGVPLASGYSLNVYGRDGKLVGIDPAFNLSAASPVHACAPDIDIARSVH